MESNLNKIELCNISEVPIGQALKVEKDGFVLAVFNVAGEYFVTDDLCTHGPGSLSESYILDDVVECNFHNGAFNIKTGEVVCAPCTERLKTYPVTIENNSVFIIV